MPVLAFVCTPQKGARLTRHACGARHKATIAAYQGRSIPKLLNEVCATCEVGKAHARGEKPKVWPDGRELVLVQLVPVQALVSGAR